VIAITKATKNTMAKMICPLESMALLFKGVKVQFLKQPVLKINEQIN